MAVNNYIQDDTKINEGYTIFFLNECTKISTCLENDTNRVHLYEYQNS